MPKHQFSERLIKETKEAIKKFGRYSFEDKGPSEVIDMSLLENSFEKLSQKNKIQVAKDLKKNEDANVVLSDILSQLEGEGRITYVQLAEIAKSGSRSLQESLDIYQDKSKVPVPVEIPVSNSKSVFSDIFGNTADYGKIVKDQKKTKPKKDKPASSGEDKKVYFITVISPYEEVWGDSPTEFRTLEKELKKIDQDNSLTPFLKKIRKRQEISAYSQPKENVLNLDGESKGHRKIRTQMFFFKKEDAEIAVKENHADLLESGSYGCPIFVLIEERQQGFQIAENRWFYLVELTKDYEVKSMTPIKDPAWSKGTVNYAF